LFFLHPHDVQYWTFKSSSVSSQSQKELPLIKGQKLQQNVALDLAFPSNPTPISVKEEPNSDHCSGGEFEREPEAKELRTEKSDSMAEENFTFQAPRPQSQEKKKAKEPRKKEKKEAKKGSPAPPQPAQV